MRNIFLTLIKCSVLIKSFFSKKEEKEEFAAMQEIYKLVQLDPQTNPNQSL